MPVLHLSLGYKMHSPPEITGPVFRIYNKVDVPTPLANFINHHHLVGHSKTRQVVIPRANAVALHHDGHFVAFSDHLCDPAVIRNVPFSGS